LASQSSAASNKIIEIPIKGSQRPSLANSAIQTLAIVGCTGPNAKPRK
jgi:hypothetical protein